MIPIGDNVPGERFPFVTYGLVGVNVLVFLFEASLSPGATRALFMDWGAVPARLAADWASEPAVLLTLFSSMYLHGGWLHLIGNMLYLWIFGNNVEDRMGHLGYFIFYTLAGLAAGVAQVVIGPHSTVPSIGASGAIAGVLGAYLLLYPRARIYVLVPIFILLTTLEVPVTIVLGFWFVIQLLNGVVGLGTPMLEGGVAWWAHIGGFVAGMVLMPIFRQRRRLPYRYVYGPGPHGPDSPW